MIELADTVEGMLPDSHKERFLAEYNQICIRVYKLASMLDLMDEDKLCFQPTTCPKSLLQRQLRAMKEYQSIMRVRAGLEDIEVI